MITIFTLPQPCLTRGRNSRVKCFNNNDMDDCDNYDNGDNSNDSDDYNNYNDNKKIMMITMTIRETLIMVNSLI